MNIVWSIILIVLGVVAIFTGSYKIFGIDRVKSWLIWAVTQAEKEFGTGTGKLKLAYVYDKFIDKFPKIQAIIPFNLFSKLVDKALENMREMLKNEKIETLVTGGETK